MSKEEGDIMRVSPKFKNYLKEWKKEKESEIKPFSKSKVTFVKLTEKMVDDHIELKKKKENVRFKF